MKRLCVFIFGNATDFCLILLAGWGGLKEKFTKKIKIQSLSTCRSDRKVWWSFKKNTTKHLWSFTAQSCSLKQTGTCFKMVLLLFETSPHPRQLFRRKLWCCFAVKLLKCFVDFYKTSPEWRRKGNSPDFFKFGVNFSFKQTESGTVQLCRGQQAHLI